MSEEFYIDYALEFTEVYKKTSDLPIAMREMALQRVMFPAMLPPLTASDSFAGGVAEKVSENKLPVAFAPQKQGEIGYTMYLPRMKELQEKYPHRKDEIEEMILFWAKESTFVKIRNAAKGELYDYYFTPGTTLDEYGFYRIGKNKPIRGSGSISASFDTRAAGMMPNFPVFLPKGLPGLYERIADGERENGKNDFYTACREGCDIFRDTLRRYEKEADTLLLRETDDELRENLTAVRDMCRDLQVRAPKTLREAMQLIVVTVSLTNVVNYGRLDVALGDFLMHDLESGILDEESATCLTMKFFDWIEANGEPFDTRVLLGGMGRKNEKAADRFALIAIEAGRRRHSVMPVLTLRFYKEQDPSLFDAGLRSISEGCIYPTLYNDDACVPGFIEGMHLPKEDAYDYAPLGCGEVLVAGKSLGSPNSTFRSIKALEVALRNGLDGASGIRRGPATGETRELDTYEKLEKAFFAQLDDRLRLDAMLHRHNYDETAKEVSCIMLSLFTDDCIAKGKSIFEGGIRYLGANFEGFGVTNSANSLRVIQKLVYEEKRFTLEELVHILDVDYEGYETERRMFLDVEKFGNGDKRVDEIKLRIERYINERADYHGRKIGFHYCTVASVNPGGIELGPSTAASADGRHCGKSYALGNSPMPGTDVNGPTAMLRSAATVDNKNGGYVTNMHISKETFRQSPEKIKAMLLAYFAMGGLQLNINCFSRRDLENAMKDPESYRHVIVRVSGYSARFVDLDRVTQEHVLARTVY